MNIYEQQRPYCVKIELTEGCNLRCPFCAINSIRDERREYHFAHPDTVACIARGMAAEGWDGVRVELTMHGEPTMNPDVYECVSALRLHLKKSPIMMLSNGGGLVRGTPGARLDALTRLYDAGLTLLGVDDYMEVSIADKLREAVYGEGRVLGAGSERPSVPFRVYEYPRDKEGNPHKRRKVGERILVFMEDLRTASRGTHSKSVLSNQGGLAAPPNLRKDGVRCARPFREAAFDWEGNMLLCCNDWAGQVPIGHISRGLRSLWHDPVMHAARVKLYAGERTFSICNGCDSTSVRCGLLPDSMGQDVLEASGPEHEAVLADVKPLTRKRVKREWEGLVSG